MVSLPIRKAGLRGLRPMSLLDLHRVAAIERRIYDFPWSEGNFRDSLKAGHKAGCLSPSKCRASLGLTPC